MTSLVNAADTIGLPSLAGWLKTQIAKIEKTRRVRSTIKQLSALTDRELNDIGIGRGDIWAVAHEDPSYKRFADTNSNLRGWV